MPHNDVRYNDTIQWCEIYCPTMMTCSGLKGVVGSLSTCPVILGLHLPSLWIILCYYSNALQSSALHCTALRFSALYSAVTAMHCNLQHCTSLRFSALYSAIAAMHYTLQHCTALPVSALHCIVVSCGAERCTAVTALHLLWSSVWRVGPNLANVGSTLQYTAL